MGAITTIHVRTKDGEAIRINKDDLAAWEKNGYKECDAPEEVEQQQPHFKSSSEDADPEPDQGSEESGIDISEEMTKNEIAQALEGEKYATIKDKVDMTETKKSIVAQIAELMAG